MNKRRTFIKAILMALVLTMTTGCTIPFIGDTATSGETNVPQKSSNNSNFDEGSVKKLIKDYLIKLYSNPVEGYNQWSAGGTIPDQNELRSFIAKQTLNEGNNNPEIAIHFPRFIEMNGMTVVSYDIIKEKNEEPKINASFIGKKDKKELYFVKVDLKAKCLADEVFNANYVLNPQTKMYDIKPAVVIDDTQYDYLKLQAKYDIEIVKEDNKFKVLTAKESSIKPGYQNRLNVFNNDFMSRLPYLDMSNEEEKKIFEQEKAVVEAFFNNLLKIDTTRMGLLKVKWDANVNDFKAFLNQLGVVKKDKNEIMAFGFDYKEKFDLRNFPLQVSMEKLTRYENFNVMLHPIYSDKQKKYIVTFDAAAVKQNGMLNDEAIFRYDYFVTLSGKDKAVKVSGIKMNECNNLPK